MRWTTGLAPTATGQTPSTSVGATKSPMFSQSAEPPRPTKARYQPREKKCCSADLTSCFFTYAKRSTQCFNIHVLFVMMPKLQHTVLTPLHMTIEIMNLQHLLSTPAFWQCAVCTTLAMFSATTLLAELKANEQLLEARNMDENLAKGLTQQATYKLSKMNGLTSPDAVMLLGHTLMVSAKGNIAAKVTSTASACDHLNKYLTQEDWSQLESANSWEGAIVLAKRLKAIGAKSIKETTKRAAVAIFAGCASNWLCIQQQQGCKKLPPYHAIYNLVEHLTQAVANQPDAPYGDPCVQAHPEDPKSMGQGVL